MESTNTLVRQEAVVVKDETVGDPIVDVQHAGDGTHEKVHPRADDGDEDTFVLQALHGFPCTGHELDTGVGPEQLVLMNRCSHGLPHLDVGSHELNVAEFPSDEPVEVHGVVRPKRIVERTP